MRSLLIPLRFALCAAALCAVTLASASAQLYVAVMGEESGAGSIGSFSLLGSPIASNLVPSLSTPRGLALNGNTLFVADSDAGVVAAYDAITGQAVEGFSIISLSGAQGVAVAGGRLFVLGVDSEAVSIVREYSLTGALINSSLISGLGDSNAIAVGGEFIYLTNQDAGTIGKYTIGGAVVDASFISGLSEPVALTLSGGNIYVADFGAGTVGVFDSFTGDGNSSLISGLSSPTSISVAEGHIYVAEFIPGPGRVGKYLLDGSLVDAKLLDDLDGPTAILAVPEPGIIALLVAGLILFAGVHFPKGRGVAGPAQARPM